jgi:hypothetical protein
MYATDKLNLTDDKGYTRMKNIEEIFNNPSSLTGKAPDDMQKVIENAVASGSWERGTLRRGSRRGMGKLANLMQAIQLLAADSETQVSHFPKFVHVPDELALTYNDSLLLVEQLVTADFISGQQQAALTQLDSILEQMSQVQRLWTRL